MNTKPNSVLAALAYLIDRQELSPAEIEALIAITIKEL